VIGTFSPAGRHAVSSLFRVNLMQSGNKKYGSTLDGRALPVQTMHGVCAAMAVIKMDAFWRKKRIVVDFRIQEYPYFSIME
jgi:hypothetical protein